ncbi:hypothetical protein [Peribacillus loiseleuriae]|uniref:Uncharacterized protein n=1 Tax=Peribacillus loiseleuriae TaxID=1679170 RepID=A0A0K9GRI5_9BACI|nr:hypothetical protein [Peribacillus loiseleuriae]KMY49211.1 hypothetical protein AC625_06480 [Peribacillus loiseleuriae]
MNNALKQQKVSPFNPDIMTAFNRGYAAGAKQQQESDADKFVKLLENLETVPGIDEKTAAKIAKYFMQQFDEREGSDKFESQR